VTEEDRLQELNEQIDAEVLEWNKLDLHPNKLRHDPESLWVMKLQLQAIMNVLLAKELLNEEELNIEYKRLQLNDMRILSENYREQRRQSLLANVKLVDGSGKEFGR